MASSSLLAQGYGSFENQGRGASSGSAGWDDTAGNLLLSPELALNFITVSGTAELRVEPQEIRLVLAVINEAETAEICQKQNEGQVRAVRQGWRSLNIPEANIVEDFISVLPTYTWHREKRDDHDVRIQKRTGYRMQSNLHLSVKTESDAMQAIHAAFAQGVSDIVTFDYWSADLEQQQQKAREAAIAAAKKKSDTLLALFEPRPPLINITERTKTFLPQSLYTTFQNVLEETASFPPDWRDLPQIMAYRPKMTFFDRLNSDADVRPKTVALKPAITVISTVRLFYQSPATKIPPSK